MNTNDGACQAQPAMTSLPVQATVAHAQSESQTEVELSDSCAQTERNEDAQTSQTDLSMLLMSDGAAQTSVELSAAQAQTDSSLAWMGEFGCQYAPEQRLGR